MLSHIFNFLLPDFCIGCEKMGTLLCPRCANHFCFIDQEHPQATRATTHIETIWSAVEYRDLAQDLVKAVKYERYWKYTEIMAQLMFECLQPEISAADIDCFVPVPLASTRRKWRGFNQAESLAKNLSKFFAIPLETHALRRKTARKNQAKLNKLERLSLAHDYEARSNFLSGKVVCLVDDVTTTGATLEACAASLSQTKVEKIYGLTFAAA